MNPTGNLPSTILEKTQTQKLVFFFLFFKVFMVFLSSTKALQANSFFLTFYVEVSIDSQEIAKEMPKEALCTRYPLSPHGYILYNDRAVGKPGS